MSRLKLTGGAIAVIGVGALAIALIKGWIKLPNLSSLFGDVGRGAQEGYEAGGIPGAVGGFTYNVFTPGGDTLRERVIERYKEVSILEGISEEGAFAKTVAEEAAADVEAGPFGTGFIGAITPGLSGFTIGAGLGALSQWGKYLESLTPEAKAAARQTEYTRRAAWMYQHPVESTIGVGAQIIHEATKPEGAPSSPLGAFLGLVTGIRGTVPEPTAAPAEEYIPTPPPPTMAEAREAEIVPSFIPEATPPAQQMVIIEATTNWLTSIPGFPGGF